MSKLYEKVVAIIANSLSVQKSAINEDTAIGDLKEWDSLHHLHIISAIEKEFGFCFTPDVLMDLEDVSDIVAATEARVGK